MSIQININIDPADVPWTSLGRQHSCRCLTQEQREAVADFIIAHLGRACAGTCDHSSVVAEIHDNTDAAAAFGSAPTPLPRGATAAPSIAVAAPPLTAPAVPTFVAIPTAPVPPAPNSAPAGAIAALQTGSPAGGVELDKHSLPWDGRIHASTKRKNVDATWTAKRGVDPALVAQVEAELRQVMGATPAVAPPPPPPPAHLAQAAPPVGSVPPAHLAQAAPPVGSVPQDARAQFVGLVGRASAAIQAAKVTQAEITQCCAAAGVPALPLLANRLDLVAQVAAQVDALIASRS